MAAGQQPRRARPWRRPRPMRQAVPKRPLGTGARASDADVGWRWRWGGHPHDAEGCSATERGPADPPDGSIAEATRGGG
eukprot:6085060-Pyramimonas_sp.AAC.1